VGRNTDYSGIEGWPKYQTVLFVEPKEGLKYVQIGTAGVLMWAPGMNEKGIVVCAHYMIYDDMKPNGWSIAAFTDEILRKANNLIDAQNILNENQRGASCGFVVTDGMEKEAFAAEISTEKVIFRQIENNRILMTNMAVSEEKRKIDLVSKYLLNEGCPGRYRRLMQLIDENYGKINPELAAEFMGDHVRYTTGTERNVYGILAVDDNVNSIIFSPEELKLWVAEGKAPVCNNTYMGLDFKEEINGKRSHVIPNGLKGYQFKNPNKRQGMEKFNQAYVLFEKSPKKIQEILVLIREASKLDPEEIIYYQMIAKILIHQGHYDEGIASIEKALNYKMSLNERAHNYLILGILFDLKNNRELALSHYSEIEKLSKEKLKDPWFGINKVIAAYAKKYKAKTFSKKQLKDRCLLIDFAQGAGVE
ncbi:MAG: carcinine hydrolase/isopenicillin-N N-acyltransferase family protein, partial [Candidatus Thorarchaeota archaeon]